jgi:hypothetical protein
MGYSIKVEIKFCNGRTHMGLRFMIAAVVIFVACFSAFGQGGGKAEPNRIQFTAGKSSITLTGTLSNSQEMEYVFAAKKGQTVTVKMSNTSLFDYRVFKPDVDFETEFESSPVSTFELPETGDYLLFVRKKLIQRPRTARFTLTFAVK